MKRYIVLLLILVLLTFLISGCSSNEYDKFDKEFSTAYLAVADSIDIKDVYGSLERLQTNTNEEEIEKMKVLLEEIKKDIPKKLQEHYEMLNKWYNGIVFLRNSFGKWDKLSKAEKGRIQREILMVDMRKDELKK